MSTLSMSSDYENLQSDMDRAGLAFELLPLHSLDWIPGSVELKSEGDELALKWVRFPETHGKKEGLLEDFIRLVDGPPEKILSFAQKRGVLMYCARHRGAIGYHPDCYDIRPEGTEPLIAWYRMAKKARAILKIASNLHNGRCGNDEDWLDAVPGPLTKWWDSEGNLVEGGRSWERSIEADRFHVEMIIRDWAFGGRVGFVFEWRQQRPSVSLYGLGLLGTLAIELQYAVANTSGNAMAICDGCGSPYLPTRKPARGRRKYCPNCKGEAGRAASRDHYNRQKPGS